MNTGTAELPHHSVDCPVSLVCCVGTRDEALVLSFVACTMPADPYQMSCCYRERIAFQLYSTFCEPKLFRMAVGGDWEAIPARCESHPKEAGFVHKYAPNDTAIHRLLRQRQCVRDVSANKSQLLDFSSSVSVTDAHEEGDDNSVLPPQTKDCEIKLQAIRALLKANRQAATLADGFGRTPLHLSCMDASPAGVEATRLLLQECSGHLDAILSRKDVEGRTPLHWLLLRSDEAPLDVLDKVLQACPSVVSIQDDVRETPLDICHRRQSAISNASEVQIRLEQCMKSISTSDESPRPPQRRLVGLKDLAFPSVSA
jgi:hypothetical protein